MNPYIHLAKESQSGGWSAIFAIRLSGCVAERSDERAPKDMLDRWLRQQMDFINALFCPEAERTFAIRFVSKPDPALVSAGTIEIALFCKSLHSTKTGARVSAIGFCREITTLLAASMPQYLWQIITDHDQFDALFEPFSLSSASVCEIRRREDLVSLETMRSQHRVGFGKSTSDPPIVLDHSIYFIHQFLPRPSTLGRLLRTMLLHSAPVIYQAVLKPARLSPDEREAMDAEITKCEQSQQQIVSEDVPGYGQLIHVARAKLLYDGLMEQFLRLQDAPYQMHVALASPSALPASLAEATGIEITYPVWSRLASGGAAADTVQLQGGGYDVSFPTTEKESAVARGNVTTFEFAPWGSSFAPKTLSRLRQLVDAGEAAGAFRLPGPTLEGMDGVELRISRFRSQPLEVARVGLRVQEEKLLLGENLSLGLRQPVFMTERDRRQHTYIVGQTGTGKTSLLRTMILSDIEAGRGVAVLDPHGDLFRDLLPRVPKNRWDDVVVLDPTDREFPVGLNLLECSDEEERHFVVREMRAIMECLLADQYQRAASEYSGPAFYQHMQMNMLLAMSDPQNPGTLLEFYEIFQRKNYWKRWLPLKWKDTQLSRWVNSNLPKIDYLKRGSDNSATWGEYLSSKFEDFIFDPLLRVIFAQKRSTIELRQIMDKGKILLVNLAKGELSETNSRFLGMVLLAKFQAAAMSRSDIPVAQRKIFYLYVDEFQSMATENFVTLLSEARKFGVGMVLANQFLSQVKDERIMRSIFGNVGTHIAFRVGREDGKLLEPQFSPFFDQFDLCNLPNWNACVRTSVDGQVVSPFTIQTILPRDHKKKSAREQVLQRSRKRYSASRAKVEAEIARSLEMPRLSVSEVMDEAEAGRLKVILVEENPEILGTFRQWIGSNPLTLASDFSSLRVALPSDGPALLFIDTHTLRQKLESDLDTILLVLNSDDWRSIFIVPYNRDADSKTEIKGRLATNRVLACSEIPFEMLKKVAVNAGSFKALLRRLLLLLEKVNQSESAATPSKRKRKASGRKATTNSRRSSSSKTPLANNGAPVVKFAPANAELINVAATSVDKLKRLAKPAEAIAAANAKPE